MVAVLVDDTALVRVAVAVLVSVAVCVLVTEGVDWAPTSVQHISSIVLKADLRSRFARR